MFLPSNITLQFGDSGDFVAELQRRLAAVGAHQEEAVSGFYDGVTVSSVTAFQSRNGLRADGIAGPETLRRLNGVMSGDTSTTEEKKEEELSAQQQYEHLRQDMLVQQHQQEIYQAPVDEYAQHSAHAEALHPAPAYAQPVHTEQVPQPAPAQPSLEQQQTYAAQMMAAAAPQPSPAAPNAGDMLAQMLLQAVQQPQAPTPPVPEPRSPSPEMQLAQPPARPAPEPSVPAEPDAPKGFVGRALQKMDAMVQKLAGYFEQKLPPDVLREVQNIGQVMAKSGVRETAIPTGPEPERVLATPARGPEQQQAQQRG